MGFVLSHRSFEHSSLFCSAKLNSTCDSWAGAHYVPCKSGAHRWLAQVKGLVNQIIFGLFMITQLAAESTRFINQAAQFIFGFNAPVL